MECKRCGKCCEHYAGVIFATSEDIERWILEKRKDILKHFYYMGSNMGWCDKLTEHTDGVSGADLLAPNEDDYDICPFRKKEKNTGLYKCSIHDTKPYVCKEFTPWVKGWARDSDNNPIDVDPDKMKWCLAFTMSKNQGV